MTIEQVDLSEASASYAVANTPLFLIRKIREDSSAVYIANNFSGDQILSALRMALEHEPTDICDYVRPYVYLVALSMKDTDSYLRCAADLPMARKWDWYCYVSLALLQAYAPTTQIAVQVSTPVINATASTTSSDASVEYEKITA